MPISAKKCCSIRPWQGYENYAKAKWNNGHGCNNKHGEEQRTNNQNIKQQWVALWLMWLRKTKSASIISTHKPIVISKRTKPSFGDVIMEESYIKGNIRLYKMDSQQAQNLTGKSTTVNVLTPR